MSWIGGRRKGWIERKQQPIRTAGPKGPAPLPMPAVPTQQAPVMVPNYPAFSPAAIAMIVRVGRSTVAYWLSAGKLDHYRDCLNEPYVLRAELLRFIREYLQRQIVETE